MKHTIITIHNLIKQFLSWLIDYLKATEKEREQRQLVYRIPAIISELYEFLMTYPLPEQYALELKSIDFLTCIPIAPLRYVVTVPIKREEPLDILHQTRIQNYLQRSMLSCIRSLQIRYGTSLCEFYTVLPFITNLSVSQAEPGVIQIHIVLGGANV